MNKLPEPNQSSTFSGDRQAFRKASVFEDAQSIANASGTNADKMSVLLDVITKRFHPLITKIDFRRGVATHSIHNADPELGDADVTQMVDEWLDPQLIEAQLPANSDTELPAPRFVQISRGDSSFVVATIPIYSGEKIAEGAVSVLLPAGRLGAEILLSELESLTLAVSLGESRSPTGPSPNSSSSHHSADLVTRVAGFQSVKELAFALVNSLANRYSCEQVAMGESDGKRISPLAISGVADFKANSPGVVLITQAMEECLDQSKTIVSQQRGEVELENQLRLHQAWSRETQESAVCSIPVSIQEKIVAVVSLRRARSMPFSTRECEEISEKIEGFGPAIELVRKANATPFRIVRDSVKHGLGTLIQPKSWGRKIIAALILVTAIYFFFGSTVYKPSCVATLVPQRQTNVTSPFESVLRAVHVQSGDHVNAGDLLFELDTRQLKLELADVDAQIGVSNVQMREALAQDEISIAALERNRIAALHAKRESLLHKINQSRVMAPADCVITECDLKTQIGQVFPIGEPMLSFAETGVWNLEISVPDSVASYVEPDQVGTFVAKTRPAEPFEFKISQMNRSAEINGGNNVFVAKANLGAGTEWMKVGMQGYAKIETFRKPVWWVALHRVIDAARINFWF